MEETGLHSHFKNRDEKPDQTVSDIDRMFKKAIDMRPENDQEAIQQFKMQQQYINQFKEEEYGLEDFEKSLFLNNNLQASQFPLDEDIVESMPNDSDDLRYEFQPKRLGGRQEDREAPIHVNLHLDTDAPPSPSEMEEEEDNGHSPFFPGLKKPFSPSSFVPLPDFGGML